LRQIVASDPKIMGGTPAFRGTRIQVDRIADLLASAHAPRRSLKGIRPSTREEHDCAVVYAGVPGEEECQPQLLVREKAASWKILPVA